MRNLYLIDRGHDRPDHHHPSVPYHRVIVACNGRVARWEAGDTADGATVWQLLAGDLDGSGWLLIRWRGLDVDYGAVARSSTLPDGSHTGFWHPGRDDAAAAPAPGIEAVRADAVLSETARLIAGALDSEVSGIQHDCWPEDSGIAARVGRSIGHVRRCLKELEDAGWVSRGYSRSAPNGRRITLNWRRPGGKVAPADPGRIGDPWDLLRGAVWWSTRPLPPGLDRAGVRILPSELTDPDLSTHRVIAYSEAAATGPDSGVRPLGYRYTLDLTASNRAARSGRERQLLLIE